MSVHAVITLPGDSQHIAGYTCEAASGFDSTVDFVGTVDTRIIEYRWFTGDGQILHGPNPTWVYPSPGTYTLTLLAIGDSGAVSFATTKITVTAFAGTTYYVSEDGNDANGGTSDADALLTLHAALGKVSTHNQNNPPRILLRRGDTFSYQAGDHLWTPGIIDAYGTGAPPIVNIGSGVDVFEQHGSGGVPAAAYGYSIYLQNLDIRWPAPSASSLALNVWGSQLSSCVVTNGRFVTSGSSNNKAILYKSEIGHAFESGYYSSGGWARVVLSYLHGNGNDGNLHHQVYVTESDYCSVAYNELTSSGAVAALEGCKLSGCRKTMLWFNYIHDSNYGAELGANIDNRQAQQVLAYGNVLRNLGNGSTLGVGFEINNALGVWIEANDIQGVNNTNGQGVFDIWGFDSSHLVEQVTIVRNYLNNNTAEGLSLQGNNFTIVYQNNVEYRESTSGHFIACNGAGDVAALNSGGNDFRSTVETHASVGTFSDTGGNKSFDQWQGLGKDLSSTFKAPDPGQGVNIFSPALQLGAAMSPVIIPCASGSNRISPFFPTFFFGRSTHDSRQAFERWEDVPNNFACWGNGEPVDYVDEEGVTCQKWTGRVSSTKTGPTAPTLNNFFFTDFFQKFLPKLTAFTPIGVKETRESKPHTERPGPDRRFYINSAMRHAVFGPDQATRTNGWNAVNGFNWSTLFYRPMFHNSKNALQAGGPLPLTKPNSGLNTEYNHNLQDDLGNNRSAPLLSGLVSNIDPDTGNVETWNAWDPGHNCGPPMHAAAMIGCHAGLVNLWNNWRTYTPSYFPGQQVPAFYGDPHGINDFDQGRSAGWRCLHACYTYMSGIEWADPQMIKYHCGGNANGDGTGQNGNLGWKPSDTFEWIAGRILGIAKDNFGTVGPPLRNVIYFATGCSGSGGPACICCASSPAPGPGTSGCIDEGGGSFAWYGPDGVRYGSEVSTTDTWHTGIAMFGIIMLLELNDYVTKIWGPTKSLLKQSTSDALRAYLNMATQETMYRAVNAADYATSHYYGTYAHNFSEPLTPRGFTQDVANAMLSDMFLCAPNSASASTTRQINDGSGQWVVSSIPPYSKVLEYGLEVFWLTYTLGVNHPLVAKWLQGNVYLPRPGDTGSGGGSGSNYANQATFVDPAWALLENGNPVFIQNSTMALGIALDGKASNSAIINAGPMAFGMAMDGNYSHQVVIPNALMRLGLGISSQGIGKAVQVTNSTMEFGAAVDGDAAHPVYIANGSMRFGMAMVVPPASGTAVTITASRMRHGLGMDFGAINVGQVIIVNPTISLGLEIDAGTSVNWTVSDMELGLALDGEAFINSSVLVKNQTMEFGLALKKGRAVIGYKNSRKASGGAIVLEG